jgi:ketosteroid isomerase-like protein
MGRVLAAISLCIVSATAHADWSAANPEVTEVTKTPHVAAVLAAADRIDAAIVAGDNTAFVSGLAPDVVVNTPANRISRREAIAGFFDHGKISYESYHRVIEYAAARGTDEVVLMGEEIYLPRETADHAGKTVHRRFTDIWRLERGRWLVSVRQATIIQVDPTP